MPKPYPREFRDDVVRVALARDPEVTLEQIATDFKIHPMTLSNWIRKHRAANGDCDGFVLVEEAEPDDLGEQGRP